MGLETMPKPPVIQPIQSIPIPATIPHLLDNGLSVYEMRMGTQEVVRIELVFQAGRPYEAQQQVARAAAALLKDGTAEKSSAQVAEHFDYYGATLSAAFQTDTNNLVLYCLERQLPHVLPLFVDLLLAPAYREQDLSTYIRRRQLSLQEDLHKPEVVAYRHITACFYGEDHPYGYNSTSDTYAQLNPTLLQAHHQRLHMATNGFALVSGHFQASTAKLIHQQLARIPRGVAASAPEMAIANESPSTIHLPVPNSPQSGIRIGRSLFTRQHPDATGLYFLNTVLGGYFGSRLMTNIREDKGYTYNISSSYETLRFAGSLQIDTEVSPEHVAATIKEVHNEIHRLQTDPIPPAELQMVKNYLMGTFLSMVDGPFNWAETVRTLLSEGLPIDSFQALIDTTLDMDQNTLQHLAQTHLQAADLWTVIAGENTAS
ncbi:MAG: pitrilysin family protein [Bacteroidota bacterium]